MGETEVASPAARRRHGVKQRLREIVREITAELAAETADAQSRLGVVETRLRQAETKVDQALECLDILLANGEP